MSKHSRERFTQSTVAITPSATGPIVLPSPEPVMLVQTPVEPPVVLPQPASPRYTYRRNGPEQERHDMPERMVDFYTKEPVSERQPGLMPHPTLGK